MATLEQLERAFIQADVAGNFDDAQAFATEIKRLRGNTQALPNENKSLVEPAIEPTIQEKLAKAKSDVDKNQQSPIGEYFAKNWHPNNEIIDEYVKPTIQGASSGPVMGTIQSIANAFGNKKLSDEIAKNAREGNLVGGFLQPEALLTGGNAANFIGKGTNLGSRAIRAGLAGGSYGLNSVVANPTKNGLQDRIQQGLITGGSAMIMSPIAEGVTKAGQFLVDAVRNRSGKVNAGKLARDVAGNKIDAIKALNAAAPDNVTSAQATLDADRDVWQSLGKIAENKDQNSYYRMLGDTQRAGRINTMEAVKPSLQVSELARKSATDPLYEAVRNNKQQVDTTKIAEKVDDLINRNSGNKTMVNALNEIKSGLYDDSGRLVTNPEKISSIMDGIKSSMASKDNKYILSTLTKLREDIANVLPGRVAADKVYSAMSKPVNQATVIDAMIETLKPREGSIESSTAFLNAMGKGKDALIKRADQSPRFGGLDEILNQPQKSARDKVVNELLRDAEVGKRANAGAGGLADIVIGDKWKARFPHSVKAEFTAANKVLDVIEGKVNKKTMSAIVEGMKNGKSANEMLNTLPSGERYKIIQALKNQTTTPYISGAITSMQQTGDE